MPVLKRSVAVLIVCLTLQHVTAGLYQGTLLSVIDSINADHPALIVGIDPAAMADVKDLAFAADLGDDWQIDLKRQLATLGLTATAIDSQHHLLVTSHYWSHRQQGLASLDQTDISAALKSFEAAWRQQPDSPQAKFMVQLCAEVQPLHAQLTLCSETLKQAMASGRPDRLAMRRTIRYDQSWQAFWACQRLAVEAGAGNDIAPLLLVTSTQLDEFQKLLTTCQAYIDDEELHVLIAQLRQHQHRLATALRPFDRPLKEAAKLNATGKESFTAGDMAQAEKAFKASYDLIPNDLKSRAYLGWSRATFRSPPQPKQAKNNTRNAPPTKPENADKQVIAEDPPPAKIHDGHLHPPLPVDFTEPTNTMIIVDAPISLLLPGSGGSYVIAQLHHRPEVIVIEVATRSIVETVKLGSYEKLMAAGRDVFLTFDIQTHTIKSYSLASGRPVDSIKINVLVTAMGMGADAERLVVLRIADGVQETDKARYALFDLKSKQYRDCETLPPHRLAKDVEHLRASTSGNRFGASLGMTEVTGVVMGTIGLDGVTIGYDQENRGHVIPVHNHDTYACGDGSILDAKGKVVTNLGMPLIPDVCGKYILGVKAANRMIVFDATTHRPVGTVMHDPIAASYNAPNWTASDVPHDFTVDRHIIPISHLGVMVSVSPYRQQVLFFDMPK